MERPKSVASSLSRRCGASWWRSLHGRRLRRAGADICGKIFRVPRSILLLGDPSRETVASVTRAFDAAGYETSSLCATAQERTDWKRALSRMWDYVVAFDTAHMRCAPLFDAGAVVVVPDGEEERDSMRHHLMWLRPTALVACDSTGMDEYAGFTPNRVDLAVCADDAQRGRVLASVLSPARIDHEYRRWVHRRILKQLDALG